MRRACLSSALKCYLPTTVNAAEPRFAPTRTLAPPSLSHAESSSPDAQTGVPGARFSNLPEARPRARPRRDCTHRARKGWRRSPASREAREAEPGEGLTFITWLLIAKQLAPAIGPASRYRNTHERRRFRPRKMYFLCKRGSKGSPGLAIYPSRRGF